MAKEQKSFTEYDNLMQQGLLATLEACKGKSTDASAANITGAQLKAQLLEVQSRMAQRQKLLEIKQEMLSPAPIAPKAAPQQKSRLSVVFNFFGGKASALEPVKALATVNSVSLLGNLVSPAGATRFTQLVNGITNTAQYPSETLKTYQQNIHKMQADQMHAKEVAATPVVKHEEAYEVKGVHAIKSEHKDDVYAATVAGVKGTNQDSYGIIPIADALKDVTPEVVLRKAFYHAAESLKDKTAGTTLTAAYVKDGQVSVASVGDSRAFLVVETKDGQRSVVGLSRDHVASDPLEAADIIAKGGIVYGKGTKARVEGEQEPSRALGDNFKLVRQPGKKNLSAYLSTEPDVISVNFKAELAKGSTVHLVMGSDGTFDKTIAVNSYTDAQNYNAIFKSSNPATEITKLAKKSNTGDDVVGLVKNLAEVQTKQQVFVVGDGHGNKDASVRKGYGGEDASADAITAMTQILQNVELFNTTNVPQTEIEQIMAQHTKEALKSSSKPTPSTSSVAMARRGPDEPLKTLSL